MLRCSSVPRKRQYQWGGDETSKAALLEISRMHLWRLRTGRSPCGPEMRERIATLDEQFRRKAREETTMMTRAEHLAWCKQRAMEYVAAGDYDQAVASMLSDLGKHPETASAQKTGFLMIGMVRDQRTATEFVQGFN